MKTASYLVLTVFVALACDHADRGISPSDQLSKRWKSVEIGKDGKDWREITTPEIIEFRTDGTVLYENRAHLCCSPTRISRQQSVLNVLTTGDSDPYCATVNCIGVSELRILSLRKTDLVVDYRMGNNSMYSIHYVAAH
ncbi:hypothetical protein GCM10028803_39400 [Larkinella knui]|uniref:Lipocalin-like domain-containing protein n=1 Tax=Larkinella knui TaxID=2025310 RepID=A0A3P1CEN8_9BACT|nr:hypothetical protein [Larkinella knui]RRB11782.1 hypothetical protein EHT87_25280 [Larkinella knui]